MSLGTRACCKLPFDRTEKCLELLRRVVLRWKKRHNLTDPIIRNLEIARLSARASDYDPTSVWIDAQPDFNAAGTGAINCLAWSEHSTLLFMSPVRGRGEHQRQTCWIIQTTIRFRIISARNTKTARGVACRQKSAPEISCVRYRPT